MQLHQGRIGPDNLHGVLPDAALVQEGQQVATGADGFKTESAACLHIQHICAIQNDNVWHPPRRPRKLRVAEKRSVGQILLGPNPAPTASARMGASGVTPNDDNQRSVSCRSSSESANRRGRS